jgi:hypothetical protein
VDWANIKIIFALAAVTLAGADAQAVTPVNSARDLTPDQIGEFVTLSGRTSDFRKPRSSREPYSFRIKDTAGATIRVCAWPDILQTVSRWEALQTTGTEISLTAEVADYNGTLELHIQDGEEVHVDAPGSAAGNAVTTPTAPRVETTSAPQHVISP